MQRRAVNMMVAVYSFLALGSPATAATADTARCRLTGLQWKAVELMEERAGRAEEVKKRQAAESEVGRLEGELRAEKRRSETARDGLLGVVKAMMEGTEQGRKRW